MRLWLHLYYYILSSHSIVTLTGSVTFTRIARYLLRMHDSLWLLAALSKAIKKEWATKKAGERMLIS